MESDNFVGKCWIIFIYASADVYTRRMQWDILKRKRGAWGKRWVLGGDFNEIISQDDKRGGIQRTESSFSLFRSFIRDMEMREVPFCGRRWTWANNRQGEGFIEEMLDMFFGSADWFLDFEKSKVSHILLQSSDHSMIMLDTESVQSKRKSRFVFDSKWSRIQGCDETVQQCWRLDVEGSRMFRFQKKLQHC